MIEATSQDIAQARPALPDSASRGSGTLRAWRVLAWSWAALLFLAVAACASSPPPLIFVSDRDGNLEIYSVEPSGANLTNLTNTPEDDSSPVLSPDRVSIAFQSGAGESSGIDVMDIHGASRAPLALGEGPRHSPRWSPAGDRVAYIVEGGDGPRIYVANADGSDRVLLSSVPGDEVGDWSQGDSSVVFAVRAGDGQGIYIRNPDGVNEFRVTDTPDYSPRWAPDSGKIAFLSTRDGNPEIYVMNADGSEQNRLTENDASEYQISWSPNGRQLLFMSERDGNPEIYVTDRSGSNQTRLTHNNARDESPVWSPNGKRIAFVSYLSNDAQIYVMSADGTGQVRVTNAAAQDTSPTW